MRIEKGGAFGTGAGTEGRVFLVAACYPDVTLQLQRGTYVEMGIRGVAGLGGLFGQFHQCLLIGRKLFKRKQGIGDGEMFVFHVSEK